ncbi:MAG TPA: Rap1a/Tai family immunity protein [Xanthobacteraceae bacterium]|nr:Rap1a/Tai family immunity protein [Xanthobacteraceae bacterium]
MKSTISAIAAALVSAVFATVFLSPAQAQTGRELLPVCESLQRGLHTKRDQVLIPPGSAVAQCWGFMSAVQQYAALADQNGNRLLDACPKLDITTTQILATFIRYARLHPDELDSPAALVAFDAMRDAFPCVAKKT